MRTSWSSHGFCIFLFALAPLTGCRFSTANSVDADDQRYGSPVAVPGSQAFQLARDVLRKNCVTCHNNPSHSAYAIYTEEQFVEIGYVVAGEPEQSLLYQRLRGANLGGPQEDMPQTESLTTDEIATLYAWIEGIP